jgi:murein DD-endopeptidase MepM/ murein hydrolase activator NlpD
VINSPRYGSRGQKPIRPDRVAIAVIVVLALVVIPLAIRSGRTRTDEPLEILENGDRVSIENDGDHVSIENDAEQSTPPSETDPDEPAPATTGGRFREHTVQDGETIAKIASTLGVSTEHVMASNRLLSTDQLRPGQVVYATTEGIVHIIQPEQTLSDIARSYAVPLASLLEANEIRADSTIFAGDRILVPGVSSSFWANAVALSRGQVVRFIWPLEGEVVSEFGWRNHPVYGEWHHHDGVDLDAAEGTTVHAAASGKVFYYGEQPGYGNLLILEHADGFYSVYGHLLRASVAVGQFVEMGQAVAQTGNTGISSGPHLHFEIRNRDYPVDPRIYLPSA